MSEEDEIKRILDSQMDSINSAETYARKYNEAERIVEEQYKRDSAIRQTAHNSQAQVELLNKQLLEVKSQNELLQNNYNTLKALYEKVKEESDSNKAEATESRKVARKANRLSIWAIAISSAFSVISIVCSIIIAMR